MRQYLAVLGGTFVVIVFSLLASFLPLPIAMWLPLIGFLLGCIVIGAGGQFRVAQAVIIALAIYIGAIMLISLIEFMSPLILGPLNLGLIADAWMGFRDTIFNLILPLQFFSTLADIASAFILDTISHNFVYNLISFSFFAILGFLFAGLSAYIMDRRSFYPRPTRPVSSKPVSSEPSFSELMEREFQPAEQRSAPSTATMPPPPRTTATQSPSVPPPPRTTATQSPSVPPPPQTSFTPPPPARSRSRSSKASSSSSFSPTAQAITREGGKAIKRLKSTGQKAPGGQSRCPYCNETIVRGSSFCNACQRKIG
ncbi:MAG: hypothetical protein ACFFCZ_21515 [Promethearchaeota archaeon]